MKLRQIASHIVIDAHKFTDYALNPTHPKGHHKARVFASALGYNLNNYVALLSQVELRALDGEFEVQRKDVYGQHGYIDLDIVGVHGQLRVVRTVWLIPSESDEARLVTLYVV